MSTNKEVALLKQKIELLQIELKDSQEREENTRRLHDTMLNAFKNSTEAHSKFGDPNIDKLIEEYDSKVRYLKQKNAKLEEEIANLDQANESPKQEQGNDFIKILTLTVEQLKEENAMLTKKLDQYLNSDVEDRIQDLNGFHRSQLQQMEKRMTDLKEKYDAEKSILIDKLEAKEMFTFGEASKNYESDLQSSYTLKDEIDKLHFIIEEKDFQNQELKEEITLLREKISALNSKLSMYEEDTGKEINLPRKDFVKMRAKNKSDGMLSSIHDFRMSQKDFIQTDESYTDQNSIEKGRHPSRLSSSEIIQEMRDGKISENKIYDLMQKVMDKEDSMMLSNDLRESNQYMRSSIGKSPDEVVITDPSFVQGHNRSLTPSSGFFIHSHNNSTQMPHNTMMDSPVIGSVRSSVNMKKCKGGCCCSNGFENREEIECPRCAKMGPQNECNSSSYPIQYESPVKKGCLHQSLSESKKSFMYNRCPSSGDYSYIKDVRNSMSKQDCDQHYPNPDLRNSVSCGECHLVLNKCEPPKEESKKYISNRKSEEPSSERLVITDNMGKSKKEICCIFKDGIKINIDIGKVKSKGKTSRKKNDSSKKIKYTGKVKNLIKKIILSRSQLKKDRESTSSECDTPSSSQASSATFKMTGRSKDSNKLSSARYEKIDEESSYVCSGSLNTSEVSEKILSLKDENIPNINKEIVLYGDLDSKENFEETKASGDFPKETSSDSTSKSRRHKRSMHIKRPDAPKSSADMLLFYDNFLGTSKSSQSKTINSARKLTKQEMKEKYEAKVPKKQKSVSVCFGEETKDLCSPQYLRNYEKSGYNPEVREIKSSSLTKIHQNPRRSFSKNSVIRATLKPSTNLRRKVIKKNTINKTSIYSNDNTPIKNFNCSLLSSRREKPVNSSMQIISTCVPSKSINLNYNLSKSNFSKFPLTTTGRKNAQQIAKALKRLSDLD